MASFLCRQRQRPDRRTAAGGGDHSPVRRERRSPERGASRPTESGEEHPRGRVPHLRGPVVACRQDESSVAAELRALDPVVVAVTVRKNVQEASTRDRSHLGRSILARRHDSLVLRIERDVVQSLAVDGSKLRSHRIRRGRPGPDRPVITTGDDGLAVGGEHCAVQDPRVTQELGEHLAVARVPDASALVLARRHERLPVGAEGEARDLTFVAAEFDGAACAEVPDASHAVDVTGRHVHAVRAEGYGSDVVVGLHDVSGLCAQAPNDGV